MDARTRERLLGAGAPARGESWADLGCGDGAFTLPLLEAVGLDGFVLALDRERTAVLALGETIARRRPCARTELRIADVNAPGALPAMDGLLLANVLHYVRDPGATLGKLRESIRPGGRVLLIEYDRRDANPWVPHPIPRAALADVARRAGLSPFEVRATARSEYGPQLYAAVAGLP